MVISLLFIKSCRNTFNCPEPATTVEYFQLLTVKSLCTIKPLIAEESEDGEIKSHGIHKTFNTKLDWFAVTVSKKSTVLQMFFLIKDLCGTHCNKEFTKEQFGKSLSSLRFNIGLNWKTKLNPNFWEDLEDIKWTKLLYITKAMWKKYSNNKKRIFNQI